MPPSQEREALQKLDDIHAELKKQHSLGRMFSAGVIYGFGFVIGSAIFATIILGIIGPIALKTFPGLGRIFFIGLQYLQR